jgi:DNA ligase-1
MTSRDLLLAHPWDPAKQDPTGWWISPKLDGIRAYWDGVGTLWSRQGNAFAKAPAEYLAKLPQGVPLDGELYLGPRRFNDTVRAVKGSAGWGDLRYVVFDAPSVGEDCSSLDCRCAQYEHRIAYATEKWHDVVPLVRCTGIDHVWQALRDAEAKGLEGVMLRQPCSLYEGRRSRTLLKVKSFHDLEATVVGHVAGKGKHKGRLGALTCVPVTGGPRFEAGTGFSDAQREAPPAVGAVVTVRYQELTPAGVPRFPVFVAVRDYE